MKLGIIGTGKIVQELLPELQKCDLEHTAILGRRASEEKTKRLAEEYHLDRYYFDYDELLDSEVDTIYVALPNALHHLYAKKALEAGKHVIVEKPITTNYREFCELRDLAEKKNKMLIEAMTINYIPACAQLEKDLEKIGQLKIVSMNFSQYSSRYDAFMEGIIQPAFDVHQAGGALMDINIYNIYFVVKLFGEPRSVQYFANIERQIDTSGIMVMEYDTFKAVCIGAKDCKSPLISSIQGIKGNIVLHETASLMQSYEIQGNDGSVEKVDFDEGKSRLLVEFTELIRMIDESDHEKAAKLLDTSGIVSKVMEQARIQAGIIFDSDPVHTGQELLFMKPFCREVLWGGSRLKTDYGYETEGDHTGEAWVVSTNKDGVSTVAGGTYDGWSLRDLWEKHRELFGGSTEKEFPLLVKLIDAREHLSIQVHPDDAYAAANENGEKGKTECWYIVDCDKDADIIIGHKAKTHEELESMIQDGRWDDLLQIYPIHKGDFFFIPAGTVHAIRGGTLILEIQQNSNITYRLYDYGRLQDGKPRELHTRQSLDVIHCPQTMEDTKEDIEHHPGAESQKLVNCEFFTVVHWNIHGSYDMEQPHPFLIVDILNGAGTVNGRKIKKGDHFIAPSGCDSLSFEGEIEAVTSWTAS